MSCESVCRDCREVDIAHPDITYCWYNDRTDLRVEAPSCPKSGVFSFLHFITDHGCIHQWLRCLHPPGFSSINEDPLSTCTKPSQRSMKLVGNLVDHTVKERLNCRKQEAIRLSRSIRRCLRQPWRLEHCDQSILQESQIRRIGD